MLDNIIAFLFGESAINAATKKLSLPLLYTCSIVILAAAAIYAYS